MHKYANYNASYKLKALNKLPKFRCLRKLWSDNNCIVLLGKEL